MSAARKQIVAMGGAVLAPETGVFSLERYVLDVSGARNPKVCFVPTASGDAADYVARFGEAYGRLGVELGVLRFFRRTPADLRAFLFAYDVVHVGGGNTRSMLATWRHWGFDAVIREAYERGIVLCGSSAGGICWFEAGVTDSVDGPLTVMNALGILRGSFCPHYDGEALRRPTYQRMVGSGEIVSGIACDDGAAAHYVDGVLDRVVAARANASAYAVTREGTQARERRLEARPLDAA